jgi:Icc-related predicted phosphoesterase
MKILTVSDYVHPALHEGVDRKPFSDVQLILSCGDLPPEYLTYLASRLKAPLYYVRGNHDIRYRSKRPDGCVDLNAKVAQHKGIHILGLEGSRWYNGGPCQYSEADMRKRIRRLRSTIRRKGGVDIVIAHAPPRHIHDAEDRCHRGFESFRWLIDRYAPAYFIHGHIHAFFSDPSERVTLIDKTRVVNSYGYYLFEMDSKRAAE